MHGPLTSYPEVKSFRVRFAFLIESVCKLIFLRPQYVLTLFCGGGDADEAKNFVGAQHPSVGEKDDEEDASWHSKVKGLVEKASRKSLHKCTYSDLQRRISC